MDPIRLGISAIQGFVNVIKKLIDGIERDYVPDGWRRLEEWTPARITRRLEELTPGEVAHVGTLETEATRQIIEVKRRLLQVDHDDVHDATKEQLMREVHRRMEAHLVKRELSVEDLSPSPLISISSLKASVNLDFNLDLKIEVRLDRFDFEYQLPIPKREIERFIPLGSTPFLVRLYASFEMSGSCITGVIGGIAANALVHIVGSDLTVDFDLSSDAQNLVPDFSLGDWSQSEFKLGGGVRGHVYLSAQLKLRVAVKFSIALCLGSFCGGVQALGFWEVAKGYDLALVTSSAASLLQLSYGKSRTPWYQLTPWSLESKLTKYAEYSLSDLEDIEDIIQGDHGGKTLMLGGSYMYMTVPYLKVELMVSTWAVFLASLGKTLLEGVVEGVEGKELLREAWADYLASLEPLPPLLSYAGPADCNYETVNKTCKSDKTIKDTMLDHG